MAKKILQEMSEKHCRPGLFTYNTLTYGLHKVSNCMEEVKLSKQIIDSGHVLDMITYKALMNGLYKE